MHFAPADETTCRLVARCRSVAWLEDGDTASNTTAETPREETPADTPTPSTPDIGVMPEAITTPEPDRGNSSNLEGSLQEKKQLPSPKSAKKRAKPKPPPPRKGARLLVDDTARRTLGMSHGMAGVSALSVAAVAQHKEKPGVKTPSRGLGGPGTGLEFRGGER